MKKKLVASIIGVAASSAMVASSYGQGQVIFSNYSSGETGATASPIAPITFATGPNAGQLVGSQFTANLLYTYAGMSGGTDASGLGAFAAGYDYAQDGQGNIATAQVGTTAGAGYYVYAGPNGQDVTIPGAASGTAVTFIEYSSGTVSAQTWTGHTTPFVVTLANPAGNLFNNGNLTGNAFLPSLAVTVPEPTTLALGGLGALGLLAIRRRK